MDEQLGVHVVGGFAEPGARSRRGGLLRLVAALASAGDELTNARGCARRLDRELRAA